ncbi:hypothetical protein PROFUN_05812 [Planoprotostelium fungivorum]|uniref:SH3 domain-containing protein n=1 Tax=Planoprotostelium fungivorum TaxID=1890364 RepID=A0A2P6NQ03_9EUKA|nr:hypothetical protein PROFUN_05812 [Planoprotostelium fungivorum]
MSFLIGTSRGDQPNSPWQALRRAAIALFPFSGEGRLEVSLEVGDELRIEEETEGWFKGINLTKSGKREGRIHGVFPAAYVKYGDSLETLKLDQHVLLVETQAYLSERGKLLMEYLEDGDIDNFVRLKDEIHKVISIRKRVINKQQNEHLRIELRNLLGKPSGHAPISPRTPRSVRRNKSSTGNVQQNDSPAVECSPSLTTDAIQEKGGEKEEKKGEEETEEKTVVVDREQRKSTDDKQRRSSRLDMKKARQSIYGVAGGENPVSTYKSLIELRNRLAQQMKPRTSTDNSPFVSPITSPVISPIQSRGNTPPLSPTTSKNDVTVSQGTFRGGKSSAPRKELLKGENFLGKISEISMKGLASPPGSPKQGHNMFKGSFRQSSDIPIKLKDRTYHLMVEIVVFMFTTGDPTEVALSLYNGETKRSVTEEFVIKLTPQGMPEDASRIGKLKFIFKDINEGDLNGNVFLLARINRLGRLIPGKKKEKGDKDFRRPFGAAVQQLNLNDLMPNPEEDEDEGPEVSYNLAIYTAEDENDTAILCDDIPKRRNIKELSSAKGIATNVQILIGSLDRRPTAKSIPKISRLLFPETGAMGITRNDLYITLDSLKTTRSSESLQLSLILRDAEGNVIPNCIVNGVDAPIVSEYTSCVILKEGCPVWRDVFNLKVKPEKLSGAHCYFTVKTVHEATTKDKEFCFGYFPLTTTEGSVIADAEHVVQLYNIPKDTNLFSDTNMSLVPASLYLKDKEDFKNNSKLLRKDETLKIRTQLTSTKLTSNVSMYQILHWKEMPKASIPDILNRFTYIPTNEVLKFFQEAFDTLFAIMDSDAGVDQLVYNALVFMINLFVDDKSTLASHLRPVLDRYVGEHFVGVNAYKPLMKSMKECLLQADSAETATSMSASKINATLKAMEHLLHFIIKSRLLYASKADSPAAPDEDEAFRRELGEVLIFFNSIMKISRPQFRGAQAMAVKSFGQLSSQIRKIFFGPDFANIVKSFVECISLQTHDSSLKHFNSEKLHYIRKIIQLPYNEEESQTIVFTIIPTALIPHLKSSAEEEKSEAVSILLDLLHKLENGAKSPAVITAVVDELTKVFILLLNLFSNMKKEDQARTDVLTVCYAVLGLMSEEQLMNSCRVADGMNSITYIVKTMTLTITQPLYAETWTKLIIFMHQTVVDVSTKLFALSQQGPTQANRPSEISTKFPRLLADVSVTRRGTMDLEVRSRTLGHEAARLEFYRNIFLLVSAFLNSKLLFTISNTERTLDLQRGIAGIMEQVWNAIDPIMSLRFIPHVVPVFMDTHLVPDQLVREIANRLYFSALSAEFTSAGDFSVMEAKTFDALRKISEEQNPLFNEDSISFFTDSLAAKVAALEPSEFQTKAGKYAEDLKYFTGLLYELRTLPTGVAYEDDRTVANLKLVDYLRQTNRSEAYLTFMHSLAETHEKARNFVEAGQAILLITKLYNWSDTIVPEISKYFPAETSYRRKEKLITTAHSLFTKGKMWEKSLELLKELSEEYETKSFEYEKLSGILEIRGDLLKKVARENRFFNEYFKVGFYGTGFDKQLRGKIYIYRGLEAERREDFVERMKVLFPDAEILNYSEDPGPEISEISGRHLQITPVKPSSVEERDHLPSKIPARMPGRMRKYYQYNDVNVFVFQKPFRKTKEKSGNEFRDLWLRNTYYETEDTFPMISPLQTAVRAMRDKNEELKDQLAKNDNQIVAPGALQDFLMVFKGVIDAAVNGGTERYKDAFCCSSYLDENPQDSHLVESLLGEIDYQMEFLEKGMTVLKRKTEPGSDMMNLIGLLEEQLRVFLWKILLIISPFQHILKFSALYFCVFNHYPTEFAEPQTVSAWIINGKCNIYAAFELSGSQKNHHVMTHFERRIASIEDQILKPGNLENLSTTSDAIFDVLTNLMILHSDPAVRYAP